MRRWGGGGGQRGGNPGEKGARSVQGVELKEDAESGIPMVAAIRRNQKITQHCVIFCNRKRMSWKKKTTKQKMGREPGQKGTGSGKFGPPCPAPLT